MITLDDSYDKGSSLIMSSYVGQSHTKKKPEKSPTEKRRTSSAPKVEKTKKVTIQKIISLGDSYDKYGYNDKSDEIKVKTPEKNRRKASRSSVSDAYIMEQIMGAHKSSLGFTEPRQNKLVQQQVGDYILQEKIGCGAFSSVHRATTTSGQQRQVAVKVIDKSLSLKHNFRNMIRKEICIIKSLCHPNIIGLIEVLVSPSANYVVTELMQGGSLSKYIKERRFLTEEEVQRLGRQLFKGLAFCHEQNIYHRDIKPHNLLLDASKTVLKIIDFGLSVNARKDELLTRFVGTPLYCAPEVCGSS